jgi:hypothetical protein
LILGALAGHRDQEGDRDQQHPDAEAKGALAQREAGSQRLPSPVDDHRDQKSRIANPQSSDEEPDSPNISRSHISFGLLIHILRTPRLRRLLSFRRSAAKTPSPATNPARD